MRHHPSLQSFTTAGCSHPGNVGSGSRCVPSLPPEEFVAPPLEEAAPVEIAPPVDVVPPLTCEPPTAAPPALPLVTSPPPFPPEWQAARSPATKKVSGIRSRSRFIDAMRE